MSRVEMELVTTAEAALMLGVTVQTLRQWRRKRTGPPSFHLNDRIHYRRADVETWRRDEPAWDVALAARAVADILTQARRWGVEAELTRLVDARLWAIRAEVAR